MIKDLRASMRRWRVEAVDLAFGEADARPVYLVAAVLVVLWLCVAVYLSGFPSPWAGERGAVVIPPQAEGEAGLGASAGNSVYQWAEFLRSDGEVPEGLPPYPQRPGQERAWLDRHVCGPFATAQSTPASRAAAAYRITQSNTLCRGLNRVLAQARLARPLGAGLGAVTAAVLLAVLAAALVLGLYGFARVRDAYRRLYVSHHRPDPEREAP